MSDKDKSESSQNESKSRDGHSSNSKTSQKVDKSIWELNEPIDVDAYEPTVKHQTLPIITKIETITDPPEYIGVSKNTNAMQDVCKALRLFWKSPIEEKRAKFRRRVKREHQEHHGVNLESEKVKACKSLFLSQLPIWFEYDHVKILIQIMSEFDVDSETYYIDIIRDSQNKTTGACLLRFLENKDCIRLFEELQGIQLREGPIIIVKFDLDNEIAASRDRSNQYDDERYLKFKEKCEQQNKNDGANVQENGTTWITNNIKVEMEQENSNHESNIRPEILNYSTEFEIHDCDLEVKQEPNTETENLITKTKVKSEPIEEFNESNNQDNDCQVSDAPIIYDHNFFSCKIVHVKNMQGMCKKGEYYDLVKSWVRKEAGLDVLFNFRKVTEDDNSKKPSGDVLLEFSKHREAKKVAKVLNGFCYKGRRLAATMGVGYEIKPQITVSDLKRFLLKRKALYDNKDDSQQPAKKPKTETPPPLPSTSEKKNPNQEVPQDLASLLLDDDDDDDEEDVVLLEESYMDESKDDEDDDDLIDISQLSVVLGDVGDDPLGTLPVPEPLADEEDTVWEEAHRIVEAAISPFPGANYMTGSMPPEERCFEAYGLSAEFMKKLNIKVPLSRTVVVYRLHSDMTEAKLHEVFSLAGEVKKVTVTPDTACIQWKKARIEFDHPLEAVQAMSMFHKQKLYNKEMYLEMEPLPRSGMKLPEGLYAVGPGLATNGMPLRGLRTFAELRPIHEMFVEQGHMERISNIDQPIKFTYKKCKPKGRPRDSRESNSRTSNRSTDISTRRRSRSTDNVSKSSSNANSTNTGSKTSNATTSNDTSNPKSQDSEASESTLLAIQALGTVLVTQGLIPSATNCSSLHSILAALQKNAIESRRADEESSTSKANVNAPVSNKGVPAPNPKNTNTLQNKNDALNQAINQVMQFMPMNTSANSQNNSAQNFQNAAPIVPNMPAQNIHIPGNVMPRPAYPNPPSRFDMGPSGSPVPLFPTPLLNMAPVHAPMMPNATGPTPLIPALMGRLPFNQQMPHNFPPNRPIMPPMPNYDHNQPVSRTNLIEVPLPSQQAVPAVSKEKNPVSTSSEKIPIKTSSEKMPDRTSSANEQSFRKSEMLVFKNLPTSVSTDALAIKMREIGQLKFCEMTGKGNAFVRFFNLSDAERCIRLFHKSKVDGQVIHVDFL